MPEQEHQLFLDYMAELGHDDHNHDEEYPLLRKHLFQDKEE